MKKTIFNPIEYLTPKNISPHVSPVGIILPFQITKPFKISILLFYDYRTARVERYLVNSEQNIANTSWSADKVSDIFWYNGQKHLIDNRSIHEEMSYNDIYSPLLTDGLMSQDFYKAFIIELLRDYIMTLSALGQGHSYSYTNMDIIRRLTNPWFPETQLGSGVIDHKDGKTIHLSKNIKSHNIKIKENILFLKTDFNKPLLIHEPRKFQNLFKRFISTNDFIFEPLQIKDNSQGLIDLKRTLNIKSVKSLADLDSRISSFNHNVVFKLTRSKYNFDKEESGM